MWELIQEFLKTEPSVMWMGTIVLVVAGASYAGTLVDDIMSQKEKEDD
ncbi:MAG: hypothetical protein ACXABY_22270 [Candidatus Thorarchaeota archaeon]|jgi:hypothetical protein